MTPWTLPLGAALQVASAAVFLIVGRSFIQRARDAPDGALAFGLFATWWCGAAAYAVTDATLGLWATFAPLPLGVAVFLRTLSVVFIAAALAGLVAYVSQVYSASRVLVGVTFAYYCVVIALFATRLGLGMPVGFTTGTWFVDLSFAQPEAAPSRQLIVGLFTAPAILATIAYLALLRRTHNATQRWRIALASTGILFWMLGSGLSRLAVDEIAQLLARALLAIAVAVAVIAAYHPPAAASKRWGVQPLAQGLGLGDTR